MLQPLGLDSGAELVYRYLVTSRLATIEEVRSATGLTQGTVTATLRELEDSGLASRAPGSTIRFGATDPAIALNELAESQEAELRRVRLGIEELIAQFHAAHLTADPTELIEVITGTDAILRRARLIRQSARESMIALDKPPYVEDPMATNMDEMDVIAGGISVRVIYDRAGLDIPGRPAMLARDIAQGEDARVLEGLPTKLLLIDNRIALVPLRAAHQDLESSIIVHPSALLDALVSLFEVLWALALPFSMEPTENTVADHLSADERRLLGLMAAGFPDEAISRQLGMSPRTLRRRVRELTERFQIRSRFQLGMHACRRGWISPD